MQTAISLSGAGDSHDAQLTPDHDHVPQAGLDLTHLNVVLATLAQFHAATLAWKQSLQVIIFLLTVFAMLL